MNHKKKLETIRWSRCTFKQKRGMRKNRNLRKREKKDHSRFSK